MLCGDLTVSVLNAVQILDQEVAIPWLLPEERLDRQRGVGIDLPPFGNRPRSGAPAPRVLELADLAKVFRRLVGAHFSPLLRLRRTCASRSSRLAASSK